MFFEVDKMIEDRLRAEWSGTAIDWDNVEFTPVRGTPFIRLQVEWVDTNTISSGGLDRGEGYVNISMFMPANTGTEGVAQGADMVALVFNKWDNGYLKFGVARTMRVGQQESWYRLDVIIPFTVDECRQP